MNPKAQRMAIAEACGAKWMCLYAASHTCLTFLLGSEPNWEWCHKDEVNPLGPDIPDYLNDLNAMHEAEKCEKLEYQFDEYSRELCQVCAFGMPICATAAQRAEAFLKTIGKWKAEALAAVRS